MLTINVEKQMAHCHIQFKARLTQQIYGLMGSSGTGKTTVLRMLAGLLTPDAGEITFNDQVWFSQQQQYNLPARQRQVGFVFQSLALFPNLTAWQNITFYQKLKACPPPYPDALQERLVAQLGLTPYLQQPVNQLSGGQRQRVALCRALVQQPQLLLLDEPFTGLDDALRHQTIALTKQVLAEQPQTQVILVSHRRDELTALTDQLLQLTSVQTP
ncbi:ATP-binding cassette domain-containing protein [Loigolactobacillus bifermentans]|uniref:ABC transporter domain-containing protein n=1 Tax=Loigolactobacillus bifermentans DSM 20003 TaxID=1423726 RepID=A0A0R1H9J6_9LACO|nr:ATP-binding cassette domain-containing protein [Loigolactobacillus bifermentans]KRK40609.1 hypothetical protein FC07_GL000017 [Loigolactobacillus bifermentans DSM 20003]QGG60711.1 ATP-binding cassette domain-containing protein [Loigolactobacillus bifermentans]